MAQAPPHIGTLRERSLHASLKEWYAEPGDKVEVPVDGYVIDLVRGDTLIEIQTGGFSSMKKKLVALLDFGHAVRIVYPIPETKVIVKVDGSGEVLSRRRSPKHGTEADLFSELVAFPELIQHGGLEIEVVLISEDEVRIRREAIAHLSRASELIGPYQGYNQIMPGYGAGDIPNIDEVGGGWIE